MISSSRANLVGPFQAAKIAVTRGKLISYERERIDYSEALNQDSDKITVPNF